MKGIQTDYSNLRFRSRLEANWAAFFDLVKWPWDYEPYDCDGWIPDFLLKGEFPVLIDVKPVSGVRECLPHTAKIEASSPPLPVAIIGTGILTGGYQGQVGEFVYSLKGDSPFIQGTDLSFGHCEHCNSWTWFTEQMGWDCGRCAKHGKHYLSDGAPHYFNNYWHQAKNLVRWEPKRSA